METITSFLAILAGILIRLALPILLTAILVHYLRKLDAHWQQEAEKPVLKVKPRCWEIKNCPPKYFAECAAMRSFLPCWQVYRLPNGHLREKCLDCEVFINAPLPALIHTPRRM